MDESTPRHLSAPRRRTALTSLTPSQLANKENFIRAVNPQISPQKSSLDITSQTLVYDRKALSDLLRSSALTLKKTHEDLENANSEVARLNAIIDQKNEKITALESINLTQQIVLDNLSSSRSIFTTNSSSTQTEEPPPVASNSDELSAPIKPEHIADQTPGECGVLLSSDEFALIITELIELRMKCMDSAISKNVAPAVPSSQKHSGQLTSRVRKAKGGR